MVLPVSEMVESACSDGKYCNGEERFIRDKCQYPYAAGIVRPCGRDNTDGDKCNIYNCAEAVDQRTPAICSTEPIGGANCTTCDESKCQPRCKSKDQCGFDGCGRACG